MSHTSGESDDRTRMSQKDQAESLSADEDNSGVSFSGGVSLKKGPWTSAEDAILVEYVKKHGEGNWNAVQKHSGLSRCGKSCRLRWANHLRPNLKKGAFTPEEEQLIIELHARMGNKWARMAAHLPGRTDNEIKNYWNTRIKRCQRAGLPLYPPNICFETMNENQSQNGNEFTVGDKRNNEHLQPSGYDIPDVIFDNFKVNQGLSFMPPFPDLSVTSVLNQGLGSQSFGIMPPSLDRFKQLPMSEPLFSTLHGEAACGLPVFERFSSSEKIHWPLGVCFPYDPDPGSKNLAPLAGLASGSHTLSDGNFSTSQTLPVAAKLELPSLQYPETDLSSWLACSPTPPPEAVDAYVESPLTVSVQSDCSSPRNSGLLEALLHEAQAMGTGKNKLSEKTANTSTVIPSDSVQNSSGFNLCYTEGDFVDPVSPLGQSPASVSGTCTPLTGGSSLDDSSIGRISNGLIIKPEPAEHTASPSVAMDISPQLDFSRPDELLGSDWYANGSKNQAFNDAIANLLGEGICSEYRHVPTGPSSALAQGLGGINSCPWSYMPPVCQMSEFP